LPGKLLKYNTIFRNVKEKLETVENFFNTDSSGNTCLHLAAISGNLGNHHSLNI